MDFNDTPEEAAYRAKAPPGWRRTLPRKRQKPRAVWTIPATWRASRAWQRKKAEAGYACITWPKEWGGGGGASWQSVIFSQEEARFDTPANPFADRPWHVRADDHDRRREADKERFVRPAVLGEEIWCQLFSEPSAARTPPRRAPAPCARATTG
jgi:alkylation response protein AidB-like acyl-CoA dehydrogenase